jgi:Asp-tRNA(Asn)/Glu-tRNA(Gln) amidotransferase A subunit family amidase
LTEARARAQAQRADDELARGRYRGPLHGVPWGAKDLLDTAGVPTTFGAEPYRDRVPAGDAAVVSRLDEAGAVLVAKLSLGALAYGDIWHGGRTNNPWNLAEGSSGSSAGSAAAVVAGLVGFAIGTETLGSIVSPCMRTGATGLRPTFGRVSRVGAMPLCWSLDKIGPLARTVEDCALVLAAIGGHDPRDPSSLDVPLAFDFRAEVAGLRVGFSPPWFAGAGATELDRAVLPALRRLGVETVELSLPDLPYDSLVLILLAESAAAFEELTLSDRDDLLTWQETAAWPNTFRLARFISAVDLVQADRLRRRVMQALDEVFAGVDAVVSPSYEGPLLVATNFTGHPSLTLRVGFQELPTRDELTLSDAQRKRTQAPSAAGQTHRVPHAITLFGRLFDEGTLCRLGRALEAELSVWAERPPVG